MAIPTDQIMEEFAVGGLKMLNAIMGEGYNPLENPKDLLMLQLVGLAVGKALAARDTTRMMHLLQELVDRVDVTPIEDLIDRLQG